MPTLVDIAAAAVGAAFAVEAAAPGHALMLADQLLLGTGMSDRDWEDQSGQPPARLAMIM